MKRPWFLLFLPLLLLLAFLTKGINIPFVGQNAYNFITYSLVAHNYNLFGYFETKLASVIDVSRMLPSNPEYFIHHPPLLSITQSPFLRIFGDDFWVARVPIIGFSFATVFLIYIIDKNLVKKYETVSAALIASFIPATSIFGRMIGQEPLVLFFAVLTTYLSLKFIKAENIKYLIAAIISSVLGTLSDWPMVYFTVFLMALFVKNRKLKPGLLLPFASIATALIVVFWISWIRGGLWDIGNAIESRSVFALLSIPNWPIVWLGAVALRLSIYFNPIFLFFSSISLFYIWERIKVKKIIDKDVIILIFLAFGLGHIILYTEASFTHPYLLYYLVPFVAFSASSVASILISKKPIMFACVLLVSILALFVIEDLKTKQVESNLWRYQTAMVAREYMTPYETIVHNKFYAVDPDIWRYPLLINPKFQDEGSTDVFLKDYKHYFYSCVKTCLPYSDEVSSLKKRYKNIRIYSKEGEAYLFFLKEKPDGSTSEVKVVSSSSNSGFIIEKYRIIRDLLRLHQI